MWTKDFVYFPHEYDGSESVQSVPRNPNGVAIIHDPWAWIGDIDG
jgi:hypothetical protein